MKPNPNDFPVALISFFNVDFGVRYVSGFLKSKGYPTKFISFQQQRLPLSILDNDYFVNPVFNHNVLPKRDIKLLGKLIKDLKPKLIGLSLASGSFRTARAVTEEIRKNSNAPIVWGGIHPTLAPEECISLADVVCVGEGEYPMWELAEKLRNGEPVTGIRNLWIKKENGDIEKNSLRPLIADLDSLPFADFINDENKFLIDGGKIYKNLQVHSAGNAGTFPIMASRGCMFSCSYCCNSVFRKQFEGLGPYLRRRSVKNVIDELKYICTNESVSGVKFWDDVFTYDEAWVKEFSESYVNEVGKMFGCYGHPRYSSKNILETLGRAGLIEVNVGIQSGSERVAREAMKRNQNNDDIVAFAHFLQNINILARYDIITDNPIETDEDHDKGIDLLLKLPHPYNVLLFSMCNFPKTPMTEAFLKEGIIRPEDVETRTSKSINNFHTFIQFSKTKKDLFWNCVSGMAASNAFPKKLILFIKKNKFFRKYPKFLWYLLALYMRLRYYVRFKVLLKKRNFSMAVQGFEPRFWPVEIYSYLQGYKILSVYWAIDHSFIPRNAKDASGGHNKHPQFRIRLKRRKTFLDICRVHIIFEVHEFRTSKIESRMAWAMDLPYRLAPETTLDVELSYPDLIVYRNGQKQILKPFCDQLGGLKKGTLYVIKLKFSLPGNFLPNSVNHALFYI